MERLFDYSTPNAKEWDIDEKFGIHIHKEAKLGKGCSFARNIVIGKGVIVGNQVSIENNVVVKEGAVIGDECELLDGAVVYNETSIGQGTHILEHANLGRWPEIAGSITRKLKSDYPPLTIGNECLVGSSTKLYRGTSIGNRTSIYELVTVREECKIGDDVVLAPGVTINYNTVIGNRVRVMHSTHLTGGMVIEDDVFISLHVGSTNDKMIEVSEEQEKRWVGALIRRGAVIGAGVMLSPNIEIGEETHIGMQSVVSKDVPPRVIALGAPLRVIRRIEEQLIK